jgi:hypothetical protein
MDEKSERMNKNMANKILANILEKNNEKIQKRK